MPLHSTAPLQMAQARLRPARSVFNQPAVSGDSAGIVADRCREAPIPLTGDLFERLRDVRQKIVNLFKANRHANQTFRDTVLGTLFRGVG